MTYNAKIDVSFPNSKLINLKYGSSVMLTVWQIQSKIKTIRKCECKYHIISSQQLIKIVLKNVFYKTFFLSRSCSWMHVHFWFLFFSASDMNLWRFFHSFQVIQIDIIKVFFTYHFLYYWYLNVLSLKWVVSTCFNWYECFIHIIMQIWSNMFWVYMAILIL